MSHRDKRFGLDARGHPRVEERAKSGEFRSSTAGTEHTRQLRADELSLEDSRRQRVLNHPYGPSSATEKPLKARSRLDYMRALSEVIKAKRRMKGSNGK